METLGRWFYVWFYYFQGSFCRDPDSLTVRTKRKHRVHLKRSGWRYGHRVLCHRKKEYTRFFPQKGCSTFRNDDVSTRFFFSTILRRKRVIYDNFNHSPAGTSIVDASHLGKMFLQVSSFRVVRKCPRSFPPVIHHTQFRTHIHTTHTRTHTHTHTHSHHLIMRFVREIKMVFQFRLAVFCPLHFFLTRNIL